ncbi:MAG: hypothetical protein E7037_01705 [Verrucomicrobia bacterium]|nr:hypothetical protein [Verrucomicrobiota bacterium]
MTPKPRNPKARYGNTNAVKIPGQRRIQKQYSMYRETLELIDEIRAKTGETASAVVARAIKEAHKSIKY